METVNVELLPSMQSHVTPLELLEDFADVAPEWVYLEEDSAEYAGLRGTAACIIRACQSGDGHATDYLFADVSGNSETFRLVLVCDPETNETVKGDRRAELLAHFVRAFHAYLGDGASNVSVRRVQTSKTAVHA